MKAIQKAIYDRLYTDATLIAMAAGTRIYDTQAPPGTSYPFIVFQMQGGGVRPIVPRRLWELVIVVKVIDEGLDSAATSHDILDRIDTLLDDHDLVVSGYTTYWLKRESPDIDLTETIDGITYRQIGTTFRLRMSKDS